MTDIQFILYNLPDGSGTVQAYVEDENPLAYTEKRWLNFLGLRSTP